METTTDGCPAPQAEPAGGPDRAQAGAEGRPGLIVWCSDPVAADPLLRALESRFVLERQDDLPDRAATWPDAGDPGAGDREALLLCRSPVATLSAAMADGTLPSVALAGWIDRARALLALNRRNRRRVHVLDIGHALRNPAAFQRHFDLPDAVEDTPPQEPDAVLRLMAHQTLLGDGQARMLAGEMDAVALDLGVPPAGDDPDAVFRDYTDAGQARAAVEAELRAAAEQSHRDAERLRSQIGRMQGDLEGQGRLLAGTCAELDDRTEERDAASAALARAEQEARALGDRLAAAEAARESARQEVELLQAQNRASQMQAEALTGDRTRLEAEVHQAREANTRAREKARLLHDQIGRMQGEVDRARNDSAQLETRLEQLRQGIESQQEQIAALEKERKGLKGRVGGKERALIAAAAVLRDLEARVADLGGRLERERNGRAEMQGLADDRQRRIEALEARLEEIETSRSYRLAGPWRRFRAWINGGSGA